MVLSRYRAIEDRMLSPLAARLDISPDLISLSALLAALLAGYAFYLTNYTEKSLLIAALFVFLNGLLDALDGKVAQLKGKCTAKGDFLDHVLDRYADMFVLIGIMLSPYCDMRIGVLGLIGVFMASYIGTQAQAVGAGRIYGGILGRADRIVILAVVAVLQYAVLATAFTLPYFSLVEWMMLYFFVAGNATVAQRFMKAWKKLAEMG